jgi:hypothetical protein
VPEIVEHGSNWHKIVYVIKMPAGTNFVRIVFPESQHFWTPQLGEVVLTTSP